MKRPPHKPSQPLDLQMTISEPTIEGALHRIGAAHLPERRGKLNVLQWFVSLTQVDFALKSPGEILQLQEESAALQAHLWGEPEPSLPSIPEMETLRDKVCFHLTELQDKGGTVLGPFTMTIHVLLPSRFALPGAEDFWNRMKRRGVVSTERKETMFSSLLREMGTLLRQFAPLVARCPRCSKFFVKPRANAGYCSRQCQNAHYMAKVRQHDESRIEIKGGRKDGTKRRTR